MRIITGTDHYQELRKKIFYPINELKGASTLQYRNYAKLFGEKKNCKSFLSSTLLLFKSLPSIRLSQN